MQFSLAWRNLWRNPRRTGVILAAVLIGVWSMVVLTALMRGTVNQMLANALASLTGHVQIHQKGFMADPVIEHTIKDPAALFAALGKDLPPGAHWAPRVRLNAVINTARHSAGVTLVGIAPAAEAKVSFLAKGIVKGRYLKPGEPRGILIGRALAEKFNTKVGRKVVLMSRDAKGNIASRAFRIAGIYAAEMSAFEKGYVFVSLGAAQKMLSLGKGVSEVSILLARTPQTPAVLKALTKALKNRPLTVTGWQELLPLITASMNLMDGFIYLWSLVVFVAMGFGIVNTTLMAIMERIREFGVLKALGMKPVWIVRGVLTESCLILIIGIVAGDILGSLVTWWLSLTGIDLSALAAGAEFSGMPRMLYPSLTARDIITANAVVFVLGLLVSLYPAVKAARFTPVEAMRHT